MARISNLHHSTLKVASSIDQTAEDLMQKSFAVFQTSPEVQNHIFRSRLEALKILDKEPTPATLESLYQTCHRVVGGSLYGFHLPSQAKRLFRAFPYSDCQPWPNNHFQSSSKALAASLHDILVAIMEKLKEMSESDDSQGTETKQKSVLSDSGMRQRRSRKRKRQSDESTSSESSANTGADGPTTENDWDIPATAGQAIQCPLDYFFYHNNDPRQINCSEHVDRGMLICVCLSSASPGLEVLPRGEEHFVCPEASLIHNQSLYEERQAVSGLICIMAGDQLGRLVGIERMACVHRVRNNLPRARLSISYELRL